MNNYNVSGTDQLIQNFYVTRWDHIFNGSNRIYVRYMYVNSFNVSGNVFPTLYADFRKSRSDNDNNVIYGSYTHNFTTMLFNEVRVNVGRRSNFVAAGGIGSGQNKTLGIKGVDETGFARFNATGYPSLGNTAQARYQFPIDTRELIDTASWIHGNLVSDSAAATAFPKTTTLILPPPPVSSVT